MNTKLRGKDQGGVVGRPHRVQRALGIESHLARFALMYALYRDRGRSRVPGNGRPSHDAWGAGVVHAFDGRGWFPDLFRGFLRYTDRSASKTR